MSTKNFFLSIVLILVIVFSYYSYQKSIDVNTRYLVGQSIKELSSDQTRDLNIATNSSSISYSLPEGEQTYNASHGKETKGPKMNQIAFSPLAFKTGETQKITINFPENEIVGSVVLFINTDNKENQKVTLTKDSKKNTWVGEWTPQDTVKTRYSVKIVAVGGGGEYNNTMSFL